MNRFLTTVLILSLAVGTAVAQRYSGGTGTESNPFKISDSGDLEKLAEVVNQGRSYADTCFLLTTDLEGITGIIGTLDRPFSGVFDGGGHKITVDITVVHATNDSTDIGLFGHMNSGVIRNLGVAGQITIRGVEELTNSFWILGGICGRASGNALIDNCYNEAKLYTHAIVGFASGKQSPADDYQQMAQAGGICGAARAGAVISNCYNAGIIDGTYYAGGIAGLAYNASIIDCRNTSGRFDDCYHIAGICGDAYAGSLISGCSNTADISYVDAQDRAGSMSGICIGLYASTVINCCNTGNLSGRGNVYGVVSYMGRTETYDGPSTGSHCYNTGNLSGDRVGGICGSTANNTVSHCYNTGNISAISRAGGICASVDGITSNSSVPEGIVTDCYNTGDISVSSREYVSGVGGIAGYGYAENIINCYNSGNISVTHSSSTATSVAYVGGIVGMFYAGRITNCVVACDSIYSKRDTTESLYTGRIAVPYSGGSDRLKIIENCHAGASLQLNGATLSSGDATSRHGKDLANPDEILSAIEAMKSACLTYGDVVDWTAENPAVIFRLSSNPEVAEITDGVLIARKTGETAVTANFAWSEEDYFQMSFPKTVGKRDLHISAGEYSRAYGDPNPAFTLAYSGFVAGDSEQSLDALPSVSCSAGETSPVGSYGVVLSGGSDDNYTFVLESGVLQITDRQTGIEALTTAGNDKPVIYDLSGRKVSPTSLQKGVYILKQGTKTVKINHH
jgi:hypothetical protein